MNAADLGDLFEQSSFGAERQGDDAIFFAFAIADDDLFSREIDIFDTQPAAFEHAEAGAVEEFGLEKIDSI